MPMEGWVKCLCPQNTSGVSGVNSFAAKSNTIEVNGDQFSCGVIQVSVSVCSLNVLWYPVHSKGLTFMEAILYLGFSLEEALENRRRR